MRFNSSLSSLQKCPRHSIRNQSHIQQKKEGCSDPYMSSSLALPLSKISTQSNLTNLLRKIVRALICLLSIPRLQMLPCLVSSCHAKLHPLLFICVSVLPSIHHRYTSECHQMISQLFHDNSLSLKWKTYPCFKEGYWNGSDPLCQPPTRISRLKK